MHSYKTKQGDTWDLISIEQYGNAYYMHILISANMKYSDVLIFESGILLNIPEIADTLPETLPPWKRGV